MFKKTFYYLIKIQYLGYRFHGWQKQPNLKTVELMLQRTLKYVLQEQKFKILGAGRTDAMVSSVTCILSGAAPERQSSAIQPA